MTIPYLVRLLCVCFASFFLIHTGLAAVAWGVSPLALRGAGLLRARTSKRLLFGLRLLPAAAALLVVLGLCVPSYLLLEPGATPERVSFVFFVLAILGFAAWSSSTARAVRGVAGSARYVRQCRRFGSMIHITGEPSPVIVVESDSPVLAMAGVFRTQFIVSRGVLEALTPEQLDAALLHERAHRASRDNFKRLLLLLVPDLLPFTGAFAALERSWSRISEWVADESAVEGNSGRSLWLASALVSVARLGSVPPPSPFVTSLIVDGRDLSERVDRLLRTPQAAPEPAWRAWLISWGPWGLAAALFLSVLLRPMTLSFVHGILERLSH